MKYKDGDDYPAESLFPVEGLKKKFWPQING